MYACFGVDVNNQGLVFGQGESEADVSAESDFGKEMGGNTNVINGGMALFMCGGEVE